MSYQKYREYMTPLCPVAIKMGQAEVHAPEHVNWGVVSCESCPDKFAIGPNRIYGSRRTDDGCARELEARLAEDHRHSRLPHANSFEIQD